MGQSELFQLNLSTSQPLNSSTYNIVDLYAGERWVNELGLYDLRNRFMSPELGRFLQADPIGFKGDGSNLYRYCHNDPENFSDPMGLVSTDANMYSRLTSFNGGDWIKGSDGLSALDWNDRNSIRPQAGMGDYAGGGASDGGRSKSISAENEGVKGGFFNWRTAGEAGARKAYEKLDKSGLGGPKAPEYGGLLLRRNNSKEHGYTGPFRGYQGKVDDKYRRMRQANYLIVHGPGSLSVPEGWTKIGWYYAHPIPTNTIPVDDKAVARDLKMVVVGAAPPRRPLSPVFPMIEFYPK